MIKGFEDYTADLTKNDIPKLKKLLEFFEKIPRDVKYYTAEIIEILSDDVNLNDKKIQKLVSQIRNNPEYRCNNGCIISHQKGYEVTLDDKKIQDCAIAFDQRANTALITAESIKNYKAIRNNNQQSLDLE